MLLAQSVPLVELRRQRLPSRANPLGDVPLPPGLNRPHYRLRHEKTLPDIKNLPEIGLGERRAIADEDGHVL